MGSHNQYTMRRKTRPESKTTMASPGPSARRVAATLAANQHGRARVLDDGPGQLRQHGGYTADSTPPRPPSPRGARSGDHAALQRHPPRSSWRPRRPPGRLTPALPAASSWPLCRAPSWRPPPGRLPASSSSWPPPSFLLADFLWGSSQFRPPSRLQLPSVQAFWLSIRGEIRFRSLVCISHSIPADRVQ